LLRTLVHTAKDLHDLATRLSVGHSGLGRARVGLLVAPGNVATWAAAFPYNPFPVPVVVDCAGATAELAEGLCRGQIETILDDVRLLRRARLELDSPIEAQRAGADLVDLEWGDVTADERAVCPPLLLIGGEDSLGHRGLSELARILSGTLPIKLLVLAGLDLGLQDQSGLGRGGEALDLPHGDTGLLAMAHRDAFVVQSSIGDADHLVRGCLGAFDHDGPALMHVHAPSPQRHGFATHLTREQGLRALSAGSLPRFTYDPSAVGLFGLRLTLQDAPDADRTFAQFAATEGRFSRHFTVLDPDAPEPTEVAEYLPLDRDRRTGRTPFVVVDDQRLHVSADMVAACEDRRHSWQVLQELAGVVTPFTAKVEADVAARTTTEHEHELATLRAEYESKLTTIRGELQQEFTVRLRDRLVELAERHRQRTGATT
jgi:pyruvate-ferredoxin/flavodoxin oxidoreductase